ncbi:MAG: Nmad3 family putative nucleotide modification protein [Anaerolineaceae bacterium]
MEKISQPVNAADRYAPADFIDAPLRYSKRLAGKNMKIALLRVGIDSGAGGIQGPLFRDGTFEFIHIPDSDAIDKRTYGTMKGRHRRKLVEYFPKSRQRAMMYQSIHVDPEFTTYTYGDPTSPKAGLRHLERGDMLVFYCGLAGWDFHSEPALYLVGYFDVLAAGKATEFSEHEKTSLFANNFHVRHRCIYRQQKNSLVLVKGSPTSRLLKKAVLISDIGYDRLSRPIKVLSPEMQKIFGDFDGKISIQRSPTRWVDPAFVAKAAEFVKSLE